MLTKPKLAKSTDRTVLPKSHPTAGDPELWFSNRLLAEYECFGISFDFFIDWSDETVSPEVWVKRIATSNEDLSDLSEEAIYKLIIACDGKDELQQAAAFLHSHNLEFKYLLFAESNDWNKYPAPIVEVTIDENGDVTAVEQISLNELRNKIKRLSGGPVRVGTKGLNYSTSSLEAYLSLTDSLYPGDLDQIIINDEGEAIAILEYKKHTLDTPIENQALKNYYPSPDRRKYDRIAILRDYIDESLPIVVVYYPTKTHIKSVKLELLQGVKGQLSTKKTKLVTLPTKGSKASYIEVYENILNMIQ